jgi:hypothetical protein
MFCLPAVPNQETTSTRPLFAHDREGGFRGELHKVIRHQKHASSMRRILILDTHCSARARGRIAGEASRPGQGRWRSTLFVLRRPYTVQMLAKVPWKA